MKRRIHWSDAERDDVVNTAVSLHFQHGDMSVLEALRASQKLCLSAHRHRTFLSHSAAKHEIAQFKTAYSKHVAALQTSKSVEPPTDVKPKAPEPPVAQSSTLQDAPIGDLINEIARRIASNLTAAITREVLELEHSYKLEKHNPTYKSNHIFKKRIVIIGLLNDQVHSIQSEFSDRFSLKCIDVDRASGMTPPDADAYLLMKNFINHPLYHKYRVFPNHVLIEGGMSTLRMWLNTKGSEL